jgi:hypothetical protein
MKSHANETQFFRYIVPILATLFLPGCSGPPSESVGKRIVESRIQQDSNGLIKLLGFRKTNATRDDRIYRMEYEAEIEYIDDALDFGFFHAKKGDPVPSYSLYIQNRKKGERVKKSGTLTFEKTEKGWRGPDDKIY